MAERTRNNYRYYKERKRQEEENKEAKKRLEGLVYTIAARGLFFRLPITPTDHELFVAERINLWRTVLDRALIDLLKGPNKTDYLTSKEYNETVSWFDFDNEDFHEVCRMSLLNPNLVFETMDKLLEEFR